MSEYGCHECECSVGPNGYIGPCDACEDCRHQGESFPHCPTSCDECDCFTRSDLRQKRDKTVNEFLKSAPETTFEKVYGYIIAGEVFWKHKGGIFEGLPDLAKQAPDAKHLPAVHARQEELAKLSGAVLNPDEDMAVLIVRDRVVSLSTPSVVHSGPAAAPVDNADVDADADGWDF